MKDKEEKERKGGKRSPEGCALTNRFINEWQINDLKHLGVVEGAREIEKDSFLFDFEI